MSYLTNPYRYAVSGCSSFPDSLTTSANGTVDGATIAGSGKFDNCTSYDGVDDLIHMADDIMDGAFSTNEGAISFWVKVNSPTVTDRVHFAFGDPSTNTYLKCQNDGTLIQWSLRLAGTIQWEGRADLLPNNTWTNIIINQDGTEVDVFINNDNDVTWNTETDMTAWVTSAMPNFRLGCRNYNGSGNSKFFEGFIDDFLVTDSALTSEQRAFLQTNPASSLAVCDGIKAYYNMDSFDGSGDLVNDAVPT